MHLVDAHLCSDPGKFISALLTSLSTMVQIELPHINVLSKVDLIQQYGKLGKFYYSTAHPKSFVHVRALSLNNCDDLGAL